jgi:redox-sensing transcriptional repressor
LKIDRRKTIPLPSLRRLPAYHHYLKDIQEKGISFVSCTSIGKHLTLDPTQVRKDLEITDIVGKPKVGYPVRNLIEAIESFLGWNNANDAFLVGAGHLGSALLGYERFKNTGLNIVAAFDTNPVVLGAHNHGKEVLPLERLADLAKRMSVHIGIITVPASAAQHVANLMVESGIKAIWNFAPVHLRLPDDIIVQNEDLYNSLASLSHKLAKVLNAPTPTGEVTNGLDRRTAVSEHSAEVSKAVSNS